MAWTPKRPRTPKRPWHRRCRRLPDDRGCMPRLPAQKLWKWRAVTGVGESQDQIIALYELAAGPINRSILHLNVRPTRSPIPPGRVAGHRPDDNRCGRQSRPTSTRRTTTRAPTWSTRPSTNSVPHRPGSYGSRQQAIAWQRDPVRVASASLISVGVLYPTSPWGRIPGWGPPRSGPGTARWQQDRR